MGSTALMHDLCHCRWEAVNEKSESEGVDFVPQEEWRYSSQWKSLTRKHAEIVAEDFAIHPLFER